MGLIRQAYRYDTDSPQRLKELVFGHYKFNYGTSGSDLFKDSEEGYDLDPTFNQGAGGLGGTNVGGVYGLGRLEHRFAGLRCGIEDTEFLLADSHGDLPFAISLTMIQQTPSQWAAGGYVLSFAHKNSNGDYKLFADLKLVADGAVMRLRWTQYQDQQTTNFWDGRLGYVANPDNISDYIYIESETDFRTMSMEEHVHVCISSDGEGNLEMYINGDSEGTTTEVGSYTRMPSGEKDMYTYPPQTDLMFGGKYDKSSPCNGAYSDFYLFEGNIDYKFAYYIYGITQLGKPIDAITEWW